MEIYWLQEYGYVHSRKCTYIPLRRSTTELIWISFPRCTSNWMCFNSVCSISVYFGSCRTS